MAVKPFVHQPVESRRHRRGFAERYLVFDHHMGDGMKFGIFQLHSRSPVIVHDSIDSFALVEFEPNLRVELNRPGLNGGSNS